VQWAIWTVEKRFTDRSYAEAFVQQTRKNVEATGTTWSVETEGLVRQLAPGRWRDIQAVLQAARLVN
jgi:hypothetical protein